MAIENSPQPIAAQVEPDLIEYRSVSVSAVVCLVFGVFSWLVLIHPLLGVLPALGIALALISLRQIRTSEGTLGGRALALGGLALSVFFASMAVSANYTFRTRLIRDARPIAQKWFALLAADAPEKAFQLEAAVGTRPPLDGDVWAYYRDNPEAQTALRTFVDDPTIHSLLLLGGAAESSYFGTEAIWEDDHAVRLSQVYRVTYEDEGQPTTFFVRLVLERRNQPPELAGRWRIVNYEGGVRPFHDE